MPYVDISFGLALLFWVTWRQDPHAERTSKFYTQIGIGYGIIIAGLSDLFVEGLRWLTILP